MIEQHDANFNDLACRWLSNGRVKLAVTTGRGPRIVFCGWGEGRNLLAETPDGVCRNRRMACLGCSSVGTVSGMRRSCPSGREFWPDDQSVTVEEVVAARGLWRRLTV
ncbi:MAG: hypothetical protein U0232_00460 [Thermomicrobiales bacterium]